MAILTVCIAIGFQARALELDAPFQSIDGGEIILSQWAGQPVLVVNTASRCGYTKQYDGLQSLYDTYRARGLVVLAVPSGDFRQELKTNAAVKDFCELQFGLDMPMTEITRVKGPSAHAFYRSLKAEAGFEPSVGSVGDSYDNALAETIIGLFKAEVIHRLGPWKTADAVEWETLKWVDWFNNRRLLQPIGNIPPAEAEETFYEQCNEFDKVA
jgi:glutathione peroxidase